MAIVMKAKDKASGSENLVTVNCDSQGNLGVSAGSGGFHEGTQRYFVRIYW